jgi:hypothetical protein
VLIITDHKSLHWIKESKIPRLVRWACRLAEFDYQIIYQPGKFNIVADALSRLPLTKLTTDERRKYPSNEVGFTLENEELAELKDNLNYLLVVVVVIDTHDQEKMLKIRYGRKIKETTWRNNNG